MEVSSCENHLFYGQFSMAMLNNQRVYLVSLPVRPGSHRHRRAGVKHIGHREGAWAGQQKILGAKRLLQPSPCRPNPTCSNSIHCAHLVPGELGDHGVSKSREKHVTMRKEGQKDSSHHSGNTRGIPISQTYNPNTRYSK